MNCPYIYLNIYFSNSIGCLTIFKKLILGKIYTVLTLTSYFYVVQMCFPNKLLIFSFIAFCDIQFSSWGSFILFLETFSVIYICIYILFLSILFHYGLSEDIEYSSLCYIVEPYCLSILYMKAYSC